MQQKVWISRRRMLGYLLAGSATGLAGSMLPVPIQGAANIVSDTGIAQNGRVILTTTLADIRSRAFRDYTSDPFFEKNCMTEYGWGRLLKGLGETSANNNPLPLERVLEINGFYDALRALRAVWGHDGAIRLYACYCAKYCLDIFEREHPDDKRPRAAIDTAERFARGEVTRDELIAAWRAVIAAENGASGIIRLVAKAAVRVAERDARVYTADCVQKTVMAVEDATKRDASDDASYVARAVARDTATNDLKNEFIRLCRLEGEYGEIDLRNAKNGSAGLSAANDAAIYA
jgi:hypothetical protein